MKLTVTILACALAAGSAAGQNPGIIQNTRDTMNGVSGRAAASSNQALGVGQSASPSPFAAQSGAAPASKLMPAKGSSAMKHKGTKRAAGHSAIVAIPKNDAAPESAATAQETSVESKYNANGRRDPFISPVVSHSGGSGCSTGKKCLEIGAINLRGVVRSEEGFIAVVSNDLNKAYFLRENDPVFNGYVVKITGDSIVFQETLQDRLGKTFTREVVKKITTPAV